VKVDAEMQETGLTLNLVLVLYRIRISGAFPRKSLSREEGRGEYPGL
jgi:hypothetical protein